MSGLDPTRISIPEEEWHALLEVALSACWYLKLEDCGKRARARADLCKALRAYDAMHPECGTLHRLISEAVEGA